MAINRGGPGVTRRRVLVLHQKGLPARRIASKLKVSPAAVYQHLAILRESGALEGQEKAS